MRPICVFMLGALFACSRTHSHTPDAGAVDDLGSPGSDDLATPPPGDDLAMPPPAAILQMAALGSFADQFIGDSGPATGFHVSNVGAGPSGPLASALGGANPDDFALSADGCAGHSLAAGAGCDLTIRFHPSTRGSRSAELTVSDGAGNQAHVPLEARGRKHATLVAQPGMLTFHTSTINTSPPQPFVITNDSDEDIANVTLVSNPSPSDNGFARFALGIGNAPNCVGTPLPAGASCNGLVDFAAHVQNSYPGTITVNGAPAQTLVVPLSGTFDFGGTLYPPSFEYTFADNQGQPITAVMQIENASLLPVGPVTTTLEGSNFSNVLDSCRDQTLASGVSCAVWVKFTPTVTGTFTGTLSVAASQASVTYPLTAHAIVP